MKKDFNLCPGICLKLIKYIFLGQSEQYEKLSLISFASPLIRFSLQHILLDKRHEIQL